MNVIALSIALLASSAAPLVGQTLVTKGIPEVPKELVAALQPYTLWDSNSLAAWAPGGKGMILLKDSEGTTQAFLIEKPGANSRLLTSGDDPVANLVCLKDSFLFTRATKGNEVDQLYRNDMATGKTTLLTDGRSRHTRAYLCPRTGLAAYGKAAVADGKITSELHVMDPLDPASDRTVLKLEGTNWTILDWSPDGDRILLLQRMGPLHSIPWIVRIASGEFAPAPGTGDAAYDYSFARFSPDGKSLFVSADRNSEFHQLGRLDLSTGQHTLLSANITWDVEGFTISPDGRTMAVVVNEGGNGAIYTLDLTKGSKPVKVPGLLSGIAYSVRWHQDSRHLGFGFVSNRSTDDAFCLDTQTGKIERWTTNRSGISVEDLPPARLMRWKSFDGLELSGFLYPPARKFKGRRPVIIDIHGGPNAQARPGFITSGSYYGKELGVAYLFPNVRGSTGFGKTFQSLDDGVKRFDSVRDIGALLDWVEKQPDLDPKRVMVSGLSHGGYLALSVAATYPDRIRCAIDVAGPSSLVTFLENTSSYRRDAQRKEYGDERVPAVRSYLDGISPLRNASKIRRPLLVVQGSNDPRVPVSEAEQIVAAVEANHVPVWYLLAKDEGHVFARSGNVDYQLQVSVMFAKRFLLGK